MPNNNTVNATKDSNRITTAIKFFWGNLPLDRCLRASATQEQKMYRITLKGSHTPYRDGVALNDVHSTIVDVFEEHHPLMALGRAVAEFFARTDHYPQIDSITIQQRIKK